MRPFKKIKRAAVYRLVLMSGRVVQCSPAQTGRRGGRMDRSGRLEPCRRATSIARSDISRSSSLGGCRTARNSLSRGDFFINSGKNVADVRPVSRSTSLRRSCR